jgi:hypothetical protein
MKMTDFSITQLNDIPVNRLDDIPITILDDIQTKMGPDAPINQVFMLDSQRRNVQ